jgi:O-antigen/teichoic acid export membrane protein
MGIGQLSTQAAWYLMVLVLAMLLPPHAFGTVAIGVTIVGAASLIAASGTTGSIIAATHATREQIRSAVRLNLAIGAVLTALIVVGAGPLVRTLAAGADVDAVRVMGLCVILACSAAVPVALVRKTLNFRRYAAITSGAAFLTAAAAIAAALLGAGVWALVVRQVAYQGFIALFSWIAARDLLGGVAQSGEWHEERTPDKDRLAFLAVSASFFAGFVLDNAIVGAATDAVHLGFYALAFTLGFAPFTQFGTQLGQVLFPAAAATSDLETVARRTLKAARLVTLLLAPLVPIAIVLSPVLLPRVLGDEWRPIVVPFQIFLVLGVGHAIGNTIAEALAGTGNMRRRAPVECLWAALTLAAIAVLVQADGIRGAAAARVLVFIPLMWWYSVHGMRLLGSDGREAWLALRGVLLPVAAEGLVIAAIALGLASAGSPAAVTAMVSAAAGAVVVLGLLLAAPSKPLREGGAVLRLVGLGR